MGDSLPKKNFVEITEQATWEHDGRGDSPALPRPASPRIIPSLSVTPCTISSFLCTSHPVSSCPVPSLLTPSKSSIVLYRLIPSLISSFLPAPLHPVPPSDSRKTVVHEGSALGYSTQHKRLSVVAQRRVALTSDPYVRLDVTPPHPNQKKEEIGRRGEFEKTDRIAVRGNEESRLEGEKCVPYSMTLRTHALNRDTVRSCVLRKLQKRVELGATASHDYMPKFSSHPIFPIALEIDVQRPQHATISLVLWLQ